LDLIKRKTGMMNKIIHVSQFSTSTNLLGLLPGYGPAIYLMSGNAHRADWFGKSAFPGAA
jgi:hypothetical protein